MLHSFHCVLSCKSRKIPNKNVLGKCENLIVECMMADATTKWKHRNDWLIKNNRPLIFIFNFLHINQVLLRRLWHWVPYRADMGTRHTGGLTDENPHQETYTQTWHPKKQCNQPTGWKHSKTTAKLKVASQTPLASICQAKLKSKQQTCSLCNLVTHEKTGLLHNQLEQNSGSYLNTFCPACLHNSSTCRMDILV
jgi:hypothetical protein